jgi:hypothetical protein
MGSRASGALSHPAATAAVLEQLLAGLDDLFAFRIGGEHDAEAARNSPDRSGGAADASVDAAKAAGDSADNPSTART